MIITDGNTALWGSHNLAASGVYVGTQEIDIKTTDGGLVRKLGEMFNAMKDGTYDLGFQKGPFNPQGLR